MRRRKRFGTAAWCFVACLYGVAIAVILNVLFGPTRALFLSVPVCVVAGVVLGIIASRG